MAPHTIETLRLLAVGSEPSVLRLLDAAAHANDWHLETSASGWDAMEQVQSGTAPHLLLLSISRGEGEGLQLCRGCADCDPSNPSWYCAIPRIQPRKKRPPAWERRTFCSDHSVSVSSNRSEERRVGKACR